MCRSGSISSPWFQIFRLQHSFIEAHRTLFIQRFDLGSGKIRQHIGFKASKTNHRVYWPLSGGLEFGITFRTSHLPVTLYYQFEYGDDMHRSFYFRDREKFHRHKIISLPWRVEIAFTRWQKYSKWWHAQGGKLTCTSTCLPAEESHAQLLQWLWRRRLTTRLSCRIIGRVSWK